MWSDDWFSCRPGNIKWQNMCDSNQFGGLGIRDILVWNKAALAKYVWAIYAKEDNLWIKWINEV